MKLACLKEELLEGLTLANKALARRPTIPLLGCIKLETKVGGLELAATDLSVTIRHKVAAEVGQEGAVAVPARPFAGIVKSLPSGRIDMEVNGQTLCLWCPGYEISIEGMDAGDFPILPRRPNEPRAKFGFQEIGQMIRQTVFAASKDINRPIITGILLKTKWENATMVAADGFRLSVSSSVLLERTKKPASVIIPAKALSKIAEVLSKLGKEDTGENASVSFFITPKLQHVIFAMSATEFITRTIEGTFPDHKHLFPSPKMCRTTAIIDTRRFLLAVKAAKILTREDLKMVLLHITSGFLEVAPLVGREFVSISRLVIEARGEEARMAFNPKYLLDALSAVGTEEVELVLVSPFHGGVVRPVGEKGFEHLIMPITIPKWVMTNR